MSSKLTFTSEPAKPSTEVFSLPSIRADNLSRISPGIEVPSYIFSGIFTLNEPVVAGLPKKVLEIIAGATGPSKSMRSSVVTKKLNSSLRSNLASCSHVFLWGSSLNRYELPSAR